MVYEWKVRRDGGIGRHAGLKILWLHGRAGSIPAPGTNEKASECQGLFLLRTTSDAFKSVVKIL